MSRSSCARSSSMVAMREQPRTIMLKVRIKRVNQRIGSAADEEPHGWKVRGQVAMSKGTAAVLQAPQPSSGEVGAGAAKWPGVGGCAEMSLWHRVRNPH